MKVSFQKVYRKSHFFKFNFEFFCSLLLALGLFAIDGRCVCSKICILMVYEQVSSEINFPVELPRTQITSEWFETTMFTHMRDQIGWLAKRFVTGSALVGTFSCVYICVFFHVWLLVESLTTVSAWIRSGVTVNQHVSREGGWTLEWFSALRTIETTETRVNGFFVLFKAQFVTKCLVTDVTAMGSHFPGVWATNMDLETVDRVERFLTLRTSKTIMSFFIVLDLCWRRMYFYRILVNKRGMSPITNARGKRFLVMAMMVIFIAETPLEGMLWRSMIMREAWSLP